MRYAVYLVGSDGVLLHLCVLTNKSDAQFMCRQLNRPAGYSSLNAAKPLDQSYTAEFHEMPEDD